MFSWLFGNKKVMTINGVEWDPMTKSYDEIRELHNSLDGNYTVRAAGKGGLMMKDGSTAHGDYYVCFTSGHWGFDLGEYLYKELPDHFKDGSYVNVPNPIRVRKYKGSDRKSYIPSRNNRF